MRARYLRALTGTVVASFITGATLTVRYAGGVGHDPFRAVPFGAGLALVAGSVRLGTHLLGGQRIIDIFAHAACPARSRPPGCRLSAIWRPLTAL